jgi:hypothetical protein
MFDKPHFVTVIDLSITPEGRARGVFADALRKAGIRFDSDIKVDEVLEKALLESRLTGVVGRVDAHEPRRGRARPRDEIEMFYVTGVGAGFDRAYSDLESRPPEQIAAVRLDLVIEPRERDLFRRLNEAGQLAGHEDSDVPRARRLVFTVSLRSASLGFLGTFGGPSIEATLLPEEPLPQDKPARSPPPSVAGRATSELDEERSSSDMAQLLGRPRAADSPPAQTAGEDDTVYEVLCILRNLPDDDGRVEQPR